ncbi:extracellular serine/threonine protein kinase FAM20C-like [Ruditapes philippinarum]|uniref:extracellular serine/threonine protein kinase FAM20C-like n=1 Tax=Ruditapes philippinarum TaxID=129788 RepID=UPI00295AFAA1|nr:extracellular serine/threonine protein kinase FAM20C-like [Ruditapes philippinarum]XP_060584533.1 extracellular serine/threonine protein kinase FAM20C-like [Ruditapes philippinarum]XP_060584534.1 extracellular serine/threonine protein kinase FAM20C-like [Ruditapes philippinarum]XP_060584535.1 extracellular serine/threonine protein kinase FAM20C-like [Ruditapes philippinarum]
MKHKARIVAVTFLLSSTVIFLFLFVESSTDGENKRYYDTKFGSLQGQFEDAFGLRQVSKNPDLSLKNINDVKDQLYVGVKGDSSRQKLANLTVMYDERVERLLERLEKIKHFGYTKESLVNTRFTDMTLQLGRSFREKSKLLLPLDRRRMKDRHASNYYKFHHNVRAGSLYDPFDPSIDGLIYDMQTQEFESVEMMEKGTELKLLVKLSSGTKAVFKPMRWDRSHETLPNHFYFNDYERHNSEIAAFHLDRVMGFYRVPPVTGRFVNMTREIFLLADRKLKKTFYVSPVGNLCFFGECSYYCDSRHSFCGNVDIIEGSLMVWLPEGPNSERDRWKSPYRRSYSKFRKAEWEKDEDYCKKLTKNPPYLYTRFIPDLIDSHVFDFLTGMH